MPVKTEFTVCISEADSVFVLKHQTLNIPKLDA